MRFHFVKCSAVQFIWTHHNLKYEEFDMHNFNWIELKLNLKLKVIKWVKRVKVDSLNTQLSFGMNWKLSIQENHTHYSYPLQLNKLHCIWKPLIDCNYQWKVKWSMLCANAITDASLTTWKWVNWIHWSTVEFNDQYISALAPYLHPMYVAIAENNMNMRTPAITAHPHFCVSPNFRLVNRISESDDITESVFLSLRADGLRVHFFGIFI